MDNADLPSPPDASKVSAEAREVSPGLGLGRWAPFQYERSADATAVRLFWGRIMVWLLVLGGIGWVSLASGAYAFVKYRRGFSEVSYGHMLLLPWKLEDYRRAKGEFLIRQGLELAERQEWRGGGGGVGWGGAGGAGGRGGGRGRGGGGGIGGGEGGGGGGRGRGVGR